MFNFRSAGEAFAGFVQHVRFGPNAAKSTVEVAENGIVKFARNPKPGALIHISDGAHFPSTTNMRFAPPSSSAIVKADLPIKPVSVRDITSEVGALHPPAQSIPSVSSMTDNASSTYSYVKGENGFRNLEFAGPGSEHNFSHYSFVDIPNTQNSVATTGMREGKTYQYVKGENGFRNVEFAGAGSEHNFPHYSFANIPENSSIDVASTVASSTASPRWGASAWTGAKKRTKEAAQKVGDVARDASETVEKAVAGAGSSVRNAGTRAANNIQKTGGALGDAIRDHQREIGLTALGFGAGTGTGLAIADASS